MLTTGDKSDILTRLRQPGTEITAYATSTKNDYFHLGLQYAKCKKAEA
jgi:hypothetical protein